MPAHNHTWSIYGGTGRGPGSRVAGPILFTLTRRLMIAHCAKGVYGASQQKQTRSERYIMLITPALAQSGGLAGGGLGGLMPIVLVMVIFYFLLIRPQQKRAKQHKEMLAAVAKGDKIITNGGIEGKVTKVVDDSETIEVEIAKDVKVNVIRTMIADVRGKNAPAPDAKSDKKTK